MPPDSFSPLSRRKESVPPTDQRQKQVAINAFPHRELDLSHAIPCPHTSIPNLRVPSAAVPAELPARIRLAVVSPSDRSPGGGWLHEIKHDGHRLAAILDGRGGLRLISRKGHDRTPQFRQPFRELQALDREIVLDGEIAVPDDRGVTQMGDLQDAIARRRPDRLAYFAFDLLHLDGHDLRGCPIEDRKALLRDLLNDAGCPRLVFVDHVTGHSAELFAHARALGAEGIVSKRLGSRYRGGPSRDWLKTKCHARGRFVIIGFKSWDRGGWKPFTSWRKPRAGSLRLGRCGSGLPVRGYGRRWTCSGLTAPTKMA